MKKLAVVAASLLVVACASTNKTVTSQADEKHAATAAAESAATKVELSKLDEAMQKLQKESDYFDFNKYVIKPQYLSILKEEAAFIKAHKQDFVTLEGNADERGSEGYNLALGKLRAEAVAKTLEQEGVSASQIKSISLGKEKPRLLCHAEKCWKENRRVDFLHDIS